MATKCIHKLTGAMRLLFMMFLKLWPISQDDSSTRLAKDPATSIRDSSASEWKMSGEYVNASRMAIPTDFATIPNNPYYSNPFVNVRY